MSAQPEVLVFGDSYTEGYGAVPETGGFAYRIGAPLGWSVAVDGVGGTGYLAQGAQKQGTYLERLAQAPRGPFAVVVVEGGSNDIRMPLAEFRTAVQDTMSAFSARYPGARFIVMGPVVLYGSVSPQARQVNDVLAQYAAQHQLTFVDPIGEQWFAKGDAATLANPDNGHPNEAGYARIADRFVAAVQRSR